MTALLIIGYYIMSVIINRYLNRIAFLKVSTKSDMIFWLLPVIPSLIYLYLILNYYAKNSKLSKNLMSWWIGRTWSKIEGYTVLIDVEELEKNCKYEFIFNHDPEHTIIAKTKLGYSRMNLIEELYPMNFLDDAVIDKITHFKKL